jgi:hypothetical protein
LNLVYLVSQPGVTIMGGVSGSQKNQATEHVPDADTAAV